MYFPLQLTRTPKLDFVFRSATIEVKEVYSHREKSETSPPVGLFRGKTNVQISEPDEHGWARVQVNYQESWLLLDDKTSLVFN